MIEVRTHVHGSDGDIAVVTVSSCQSGGNVMVSIARGNSNEDDEVMVATVSGPDLIAAVRNAMNVPE